MQIHCGNGHLGVYKIAKLLKPFIWVPRLDQLIPDIISTCPVDQCMKAFTAKHKAPVHKNLNTMPFETIVIDVLALTKTSNQISFVIVICDQASKWIQVYPVRNHTAKIGPSMQ